MGREGGENRERERKIPGRKGRRERNLGQGKEQLMSNKQVAACPRVLPNTLLDHSVCKYWEQIWPTNLLWSPVLVHKTSLESLGLGVMCHKLTFACVHSH